MAIIINIALIGTVNTKNPITKIAIANGFGILIARITNIYLKII